MGSCQQARPLCAWSKRENPRAACSLIKKASLTGWARGRGKRGGWRGKQQEARSWAAPGVTHLPAGAHPELSAGWRGTWCHLLGSCPGWWTPLALAPTPVLCDSRNACSPLGFTDPKEENETGLFLPL